MRQKKKKLYWRNRPLENRVGLFVVVEFLLFYFLYELYELYILANSKISQDDRINYHSDDHDCDFL